MGKAGSILAAVALVLTAGLVPGRSTATQAQSAPSSSCTQQPTDSPMQGHYTGPWHSEGDYHFTVSFPPAGGNPAQIRDLELKLTLDGTLDLTVSSDGQATGTASAKVAAPIYHEGAQDISSGIGTLSGKLTGSLSPGGPGLVLAQPVIDMHWGTFDGPNVERWITMPDFQLPQSSAGCVSAGGTVSEDGFPLQNITNDSTGQLAQAPGVGTATGTWQVASDKSARFDELSRQVDTFIAGANAFLADASVTPTPALVDQKLVQPLKSLENTIRQDPDVARCLLSRLGAWETSVLPGLFQRARTMSASTDLSILRRAGDLIRSAGELNVDCSIGDGGAESTLLGAEMTLLGHVVSGEDWPDLALLPREILLLEGEAVRPRLQQEVQKDIHALLAGTTSPPAVLDLARIAHALGDDADAQAALHRLPSRFRPLMDTVPWQPSTPAPKKQKKRHKRSPTVSRPTPRPRPSPTPTATPTPPARSLAELLSANLITIQTAVSPDASPTLSWRPVQGAQRYLVFVTRGAQPEILWAWSGSASSVTFGDTSIEGVQGTENDRWPIAFGPDAAWSVLALNAQGQIVGARFR